MATECMENPTIRNCIQDILELINNLLNILSRDCQGTLNFSDIDLSEFVRSFRCSKPQFIDR